jgi:hypothetical protein
MEDCGENGIECHMGSVMAGKQKQLQDGIRHMGACETRIFKLRK